MFYSPFFELLTKYEKHIFDFFLYLTMYLIAYLVDSYVVSVYDRNLPTLSLIVLIISYLSARFIIRKYKKQKYFGLVVNWSPLYTTIMAFVSWFAYLLFTRSRMGL
jgi:hypothetical protein